MFLLEVGQVVSMLRDVLIPTDDRFPDSPRWKSHEDGSISKPGALIQLTCELQGSRSIDVTIVLCGNTNAFAAATHRGSGVQAADFKNLSNHDTCWRDAVRTFFHEQGMMLYREVCDGPGSTTSNVSVRDMQPRARFTLFKTPKAVMVRICADKEKAEALNFHGYWKKLVSFG